MKAHFELKSLLHDISGKDIESYKSIEGEYLFGSYTLIIDYVIGNSSKARIQLPQEFASFPDDTYSSRSREIALRDYIARIFHEEVKKLASDLNCAGNIQIDIPGQEILDRTSVFIDSSCVELRFTIDLPSKDGKVVTLEAEKIFFEELPKIIEASALFENLDSESLYNHIKTNEDADFLRAELENIRLIAFVAEGSILPRESKDNPYPMSGNDLVPFVSPDKLKMDVELPNRGQITGMGIPRGITFIVGECNSGKTTLIDAISQGIYNHIPGDGREFVISNPNSVQIKREPGRNVTNVNISPFINNDSDTDSFSTQDADSDISLAANIVEAVEIGADVLLFDDEDTSLYIHKTRALFNEYMVSTILATDNLDEHLNSANFVIKISDYRAKDITPDTKEDDVSVEHVGYIGERIPIAESIEDISIDLSNIEQVVSDSQTTAIRDSIEYAKKYMDGKKSFRQVTSLVMLDIGRSGLDILNPNKAGNYAEFRKIEFAAAINRIRNLKVEQK